MKKFLLLLTFLTTFAPIEYNANAFLSKLQAQSALFQSRVAAINTKSGRDMTGPEILAMLNNMKELKKDFRPFNPKNHKLIDVCLSIDKKLKQLEEIFMITQPGINLAREYYNLMISMEKDSDLMMRYQKLQRIKAILDSLTIEAEYAHRVDNFKYHYNEIDKACPSGDAQSNASAWPSKLTIYSIDSSKFADEFDKIKEIEKMFIDCEEASWTLEDLLPIPTQNLEESHEGVTQEVAK